MTIRNIVGERFGRLVVIERDTKNGSQWKCMCDCGNSVSIYRGSLLTGNTKSCGCLRKEVSSARDKVESRLVNLLSGSLDSYYWIGYLMADGTIGFKTLRIKLALANKDASQVIKFSRFIGCNNIHRYCEWTEVQAQDQKIVPKIIKRFGFKQNKTHNPCDLTWTKNLSENDFLSFVVGFIDGDGCIRLQHKRTDAKITVQVHGSWIDNLNIINKRLQDITGEISGNPHINKSGYAFVCWANSRVIQTLRRAAKGLPVLDRKWTIIPLKDKE